LEDSNAKPTTDGLPLYWFNEPRTSFNWPIVFAIGFPPRANEGDLSVMKATPLEWQVHSSIKFQQLNYRQNSAESAQGLA